MYKFSHIVNGRVKYIYVFNGQKDTQALDRLFAKNPSDALFAGIFSPEELTEIRDDNIEVRFIPEHIHLDDTIEIIKKKLLLHLSNALNVSFPELYFFIMQTEHFKATTIYQNLTQNDKLDLTKERITQFLLNLDEFDIETLPAKELYTYDDILELNLEQTAFTVCKPLGQKLVSLKDDYPYTVNPYYVETYEPFLEKFADEIITTTNKNILMDAGPFLNNTIYLCLAEDVLAFNSTTLAEASTLKIYFPYLSGADITSTEQLTDKKQVLLRETKEMLTPVFEKNIENVNLFYEIYEQRKEELAFKDIGIQSLVIVIHQATEIKLPLDNVFKLIHATQEVPLIKMNLSKKQENMFRLYADKIATTGKRIPYLDKGVIFKWEKMIGKGKSVAAYIEHYDPETGALTPIICEFNNNGSIVIKANFNTSLTPDAINELFGKQVNPVIDSVKEYLAQDGYVFNNFVDLRHKNIEILNIEFAMTIQITKDIKLKKIIGCLTSMFNVIKDDLSQGILMRFKRVSNYNEKESQETLIIDMSQPQLGYTDADIIKVLQNNFHLSEQEAIEKYAEVKSAQEAMEAGNKRMKKRPNPGFLTVIEKQKFSDILMIKVSGITHLDYLQTLYIYFDSLIRITQNPASTQVKNERIKKICAGKQVGEEKQVVERIALIEQPNIQMIIVDEELVKKGIGYEEVEEEEVEEELMDEDELLARFGNQEEEEEEEDIEVGGAGSDEEASGAEDEADEDEEASEADEEASEADEEGVVGAQPLEKHSSEEGVVGLAAQRAQPLIDITGQSLASPSPFEQRMIKRDKTLFVTDTGKKNFKSYAKTCAWNRRRHPVILTDAEKERIDKEHPGSYSEAVKYGTKPDKKFWYICPRYWDLKNNTSLSAEEVENNPDYKNAVIPKKPLKNKVPAGKHIFEFNDNGIEHLDEKKKYIPHYPGFLKPDDNGKCIPCCFKSWSEPTQAKRRAECTKDNTIVVPQSRKKKRAAEEIDEYILAPDKFPITQENRFGYLPIAVQKFLHTDNKKCQMSDMNPNMIKPNHECLLRHSVEINQNQSFIASIADACQRLHTKSNNEMVRPTIKRMKEIMIESLTIDNFITLQNGNLLKLFYTQSDDLNDMEKYADVFSKSASNLYDIADKKNPSQVNALIKIARAYANFVAYLKDDTVEIDYEYLWDLICKPNPKLFPNGINLVIIELMRKDMTENVELICPSNHYASTFFDIKKSTILLLKIDNFYEPIYAYKTNDVEITITRTFNMMYKDILPNIKYVLNLIKDTFNTKCGALASMPVVYKFQKNIPLEKLINYLQHSNYTVEKQVMNYDSKVIGVVAIDNRDNSKGFIPCNPSSALTYDNIYMSDAYADTYEKTKAFLEKVYAKSKQKIPCNPSMKIIDDGLIIGILTMTNQFVLIAEPTQDTFGSDLKIMLNTNYQEVDETLSTSTAVDTERVNYIKKIQLETKFYNVFRNTARYLLGQYQNNDIRKEIEEKTKSSQLYLKKLRSIETLLRDLMKNHVDFFNYAEDDLLRLDTIANCYNNSENKAYCRANLSNANLSNANLSNANLKEGVLLVPETNLINQKLNNTFYFGKLADEIVRYSRIKSFIFNTKSVLSFSQLKYNLRENEIILSQSLLTQEYFENISAAKVNQYIKYNTYDTTQPIITQKYSNIHTFEKNVEENEQQNCLVTVKEYIPNKYWHAIFPATSKEYIYASQPMTCSFNAILTLIQDNDAEQKNLTVNQLKENLLSEYLKIYNTYGSQLLQIMRAQGKKILAGQILKKQMSIPDMIISEEYYATNLDVWLLAIYYKLPFVFISDTSLLENNARFMVANKPTAEASAFYFLKVSATLPQMPPIYTLIVAGESKKIAVESLRAPDIQIELRGASEGNTLNRFIEHFSLTDANTRKKIIKLVPKTVAPTAQLEPATVAAPTVAAPHVAAPHVDTPTVPTVAPVKKITKKLVLKEKENK